MAVPVLKMACASGKTFTVRRDLISVAKEKLVVVEVRRLPWGNDHQRRPCARWRGSDSHTVHGGVE